MTNLNPEQIYRRTQDSLNNIGLSLQDLIGNISLDSTIQRKIELFDLNEAVADGVLTEEELRPVLNSLESVDFRALAEQGYIKYNSRQGRYSIDVKKLRANSHLSLLPDLNRDSEINLKDIQALEFVINFKNINDSKISLEDQLAAIENPNLLVRKELEQAAIRRGLRSDPPRFDAFMDKFYRNYFSNEDFSFSRTELTRLLEVFDIFERQDANFDLDKLDYYAELLKRPNPELEDTYISSPAAKYLNAFAIYEAEAGFSNEHRDGMTQLVSRIEAAVDNQDARTLRTIEQILRNKSIPLTTDAFSMQNINGFLDKLNHPVEYPKMVINSWAEQSFPAHETTRKVAFIEKMTSYHQSHTEFFNEDSFKALTTIAKVKDLYLNSYKKFQADIKKINRNLYENNDARINDSENAIEKFDKQIEKLDFYADLALELRSKENPDGYNLRHLNVIFNYDNHRDFYLTGQEREDKLREYLNILQVDKDSNEKELQDAKFINYIFKSRSIPFSPPGTAITPENIDAFLLRIENEEAFYQFQLEDMATRSNLHTYPSPENNIHADFVNKFMYYKYDFGENHPSEQNLTDGQIIHAKYLFDILKSKSQTSFNFEELDFYVNYMQSGLEFRTLAKFINKLHHRPRADRKRYLDVLSDPNPDQETAERQKIILRYLDHN
jgi:hypothetical protein